MAAKTTMQEAVAYAMYKRTRVAQGPQRVSAPEQLEERSGEPLLTPNSECMPDDHGRTPVIAPPVFEGD